MNDLDAKTFNDIATVLKKSILEWYGPGAYLDTSRIPQVRSFAHSFIARYIVSGSESQTLLVKIAHKANQSDLQFAINNDALRALARREMHQLQATWQAFKELNDPDLIAVQPLAYLEPWNAIVMVEVQAQSLKSILASPKIGLGFPKASEQFIQHLQKASKWLRHFHDHVGGSQVGAASRTLMQARLDKVSRDVNDHMGTRFDTPKKIGSIKLQIDNVSGLEPVAQMHGDFHCSNILVTPRGQICVLDPRADSSRKSVYNDLATLLIDLHVKPIPMLTSGKFAKTFLAQSRQAIMESYFKAGESSKSLLDFYCACEVIYKWSMDERDFINSKKMRMVAPLIHPIHSRYMSQLISQFLTN